MTNSRMLPQRLLTVLAVIASLMFAVASSDSDDRFDDDDHSEPDGSVRVVAADDVQFVTISPFASFGPAQGDFTTGGHGTFGIFGAEAASPPHTHSGTYYGVVISGQMNNPFGTEPNPPVLSPGSFWAVPADEQHVTACLSADQECGFFFHSASAFDFLPINESTEPRGPEARSIPVEELAFMPLRPFDGAATVWGDPDGSAFGVIVRLDADSETDDFIVESALTIVPLTGQLELESEGGLIEGEWDLANGSLVDIDANTELSIECDDDHGACLAYVFSESGALALSLDD